MYSVVEFLIDASNAVIKNSWLMSKNHCYFPPNNSYKKMIKCENNNEEISKWKVYAIKIIKQFENLEAAQDYSKFLSQNEDTDFADNLKIQKKKKRDHPYKSIFEEYDLSSKTKKLKHASVQPIYETSCTSPPVLDNNEEEEYILEELDDQPNMYEEEQHFEANQTRNLTFHESNNDNSVLLYQITQIIKAEGERILQHVDEKIEQLREYLSIPSETHFVKLKDKEELKAFSDNLMENENYMNRMVLKLKAIDATGKHHLALHGKIGGFLEYLFESNFFANIRWGEKAGSHVEDRICLADYNSVMMLFRKSLLEIKNGNETLPESETVAKSIKNYFKQKLQASKKNNK